MNNNIVLYKDMVFETGLSYEDACELLRKANKSPAAEFIVFSISSKSDTEWSFKGRCKQLTKLFLTNPEKFVIKR